MRARAHTHTHTHTHTHIGGHVDTFSSLHLDVLASNKPVGRLAKLGGGDRDVFSIGSILIIDYLIKPEEINGEKRSSLQVELRLPTRASVYSREKGVSGSFISRSKQCTIKLLCNNIFTLSTASLSGSV